VSAAPEERQGKKAFDSEYLQLANKLQEQEFAAEVTNTHFALYPTLPFLVFVFLRVLCVESLSWDIHHMDQRHSSLVVAAWLVITSIAAHGEDVAPDTTKAIELSQSVIGARIADYAFTDSRGRAVRLSDYRGKPLLVNFVYTGCSQVCPTTVRFR
jgi:hypothetical protein